MPPNDAVLIRRSPDTSPSTDEALPADADSHLQRHGLPAPSMGLAIGRLAAINSTDSPGMGSSAVRGPPVASMPAHSGAPPSLDITEPVSTDASASVPRSDVRAADPARIPAPASPAGDARPGAALGRRLTDASASARLAPSSIDGACGDLIPGRKASMSRAMRSYSPPPARSESKRARRTDTQTLTGSGGAAQVRSETGDTRLPHPATHGPAPSGAAYTPPARVTDALLSVLRTGAGYGRFPERQVAHGFAPPQPRWGTENAFLRLCASNGILVTTDTVERTTRAAGIGDAAATAIALGVSALELTACILWTKQQLANDSRLWGHPFTLLSAQAMYLLAGVVAHCCAQSDELCSSLFPNEERLHDAASCARVYVNIRQGPYFDPPRDANGDWRTFQALCEALELSEDRTPSGLPDIAGYYRLSMCTHALRQEEKSAIRFAAWLYKQTPACIAAHGLLLPYEDQHVLVRLARTAAAHGRRGPDSLYGILVRTVFEALIHAVLPSSDYPGPLPDDFPVGRDYRETKWIQHPPEAADREALPLSFAEAFAVMEWFGTTDQRFGPAPRMVQGVMHLAPVEAVVLTLQDIRRVLAAMDCPHARKLAQSMTPACYFGRDERLRGIVLDLASFHTGAAHTAALHDRPTTLQTTIRRFLLAQFVRNCFPSPATPRLLSDAECSTIETEGGMTPCTIAASLRRARDRRAQAPSAAPRGEGAAAPRRVAGDDSCDIDMDPGLDPDHGAGAAASDAAFPGQRKRRASPPAYTTGAEAADDAYAAGAAALDQELAPPEGDGAAPADDDSIVSDPGPVEAFVRSVYQDLHLAVRDLQSRARAQPSFVTADGGANIDALNHLRDTLGSVTQALTEVATWMWATEAPTEQCPSGRDASALADIDRPAP